LERRVTATTDSTDAKSAHEPTLVKPSERDAFWFCMALPGPEARQLASYVGYSLYGVRGATTSGGLLVYPASYCCAP
jgi:hypothetical protein